MRSVTPTVGWWYTFCCLEDLAQIANEQDLADALESEMEYRFWPTKEDALSDLAKEQESPDLKMPEDLARRLIEIARP